MWPGRMILADMGDLGKGYMVFSGGTVVKNPPVSAGDVRDVGSIPRLGRSSGLGNGNLASTLLPENSHA